MLIKRVAKALLKKDGSKSGTSEIKQLPLLLNIVKAAGCCCIFSAILAKPL